MWTVVYIAPTKRIRDRLTDALTVEGFMVSVRPVGTKGNTENCQYEVLVPESEVDEAMEIINSITVR